MGSFPLPSSSSSSLLISSSSSISGRPSSTIFYPHRRFRKAQALSISCDYSCFEIRDVSYRPPGTKINLLSQVNLSIPEKRSWFRANVGLFRLFLDWMEAHIRSEIQHLRRFSNVLAVQYNNNYPVYFGLIFGRSGSGKTTLLQLLAGLSKPTSGSIYVQRCSDGGEKIKSPEPLQPERVGIVFQFPGRYFVADTLLDEVTFGWPRQKGGLQLRELLASGLQKAITSVGLAGMSLDKDPHSLSGGYKRRLALAIQLVQSQNLLILDEPLAGLVQELARLDLTSVQVAC